MRRAVRLLVLPFIFAFTVMTAGMASASPQRPDSIAALGDSMTRATDACCWYGDHPANSWSTGSAGWDGVSSHYERIRGGINPRVVAYNDSRAGAKAVDLKGQATLAVSQKAEYVTVLMGANDVCTSSPATMTSETDFRAQIRAGLQTLATGLPRSRIFVSSIPNIYQLWSLLHTNSTAQFVWPVADICQSMLSTGNSEQTRLDVQAHEIKLNAILEQECASVANCRFDNHAVYNYKFTAGDVSSLDYFHPSLRGQANLARVTWSSSWWG